MKYLGLWSPGQPNFIWKICKTLRSPPPNPPPPPTSPAYLKYGPLSKIRKFMFIFLCQRKPKSSYYKICVLKISVKFQKNDYKGLIPVFFLAKFQKKTLNISQNALFTHVLMEILLKYWEKLTRYIRIFGTTNLQNSHTFI